MAGIREPGRSELRVAHAEEFPYLHPMSFDPAAIQLPPPGVETRMPPKNRRELSYEEKYQQVRLHLKDGDAGTMSVQMIAQINGSHAHTARVCTAG